MATLEQHPAPARDHCLAPSRIGDGRVDAPLGAGRYGRLFPGLERLEAEEEMLLGLGATGGLCDGSETADDDAQGAAGWPFFGQWIAHDITADRSPLVPRADEESLRNFREPRANLESVYGQGPIGEPFLYAHRDPAKLLFGERGADVPRNQEGIALIGDPRNDVHLLMAQLHVAFLRLHNALVDRLRAAGVGEGELFEEARRTAIWHYQWLILRDFLPRLVGEELAGELLARGARLLPAGGELVIPLEFADAAFRYGHSQIRRAYRVSERSPELPLLPDLMGFGPVPAEREVAWDWFFDLPGRPARQRAKRIDARLPGSLIALPLELTGEVETEAFHSLAARDLQRGQATGLPSGEAVARELGVEPLTPDEVGLAETGWESETPLWLYVLLEADARTEGERLGPVGGRIVGEVLVSIVDRDPASYRSVDPGWRPSLPAADPERFGLGDLLSLVSPAEAGS